MVLKSLQIILLLGLEFPSIHMFLKMHSSWVSKKGAFFCLVKLHFLSMKAYCVLSNSSVKAIVPPKSMSTGAWLLLCKLFHHFTALWIDAGFHPTQDTLLQFILPVLNVNVTLIAAVVLSLSQYKAWSGPTAAWLWWLSSTQTYCLWTNSHKNMRSKQVMPVNKCII